MSRTSNLSFAVMFIVGGVILVTAVITMLLCIHAVERSIDHSDNDMAVGRKTDPPYGVYMQTPDMRPFGLDVNGPQQMQHPACALHKRYVQHPAHIPSAPEMSAPPSYREATSNW